QITDQRSLWRGANGPFGVCFHLPDAAGPAWQRQQSLRDVVFALVVAYAQRVERLENRLFRANAFGVESAKFDRQRLAPLFDGPAVAIQGNKRAVETGVAIRQQPRRHPLIEISGAEANQNVVNQHVCVFACRAKKEVAMPNDRASRRARSLHGVSALMAN